MNLQSGSKTVVIGAGIAGMACAALLAKAGHSVRLIEKHQSVGGRNRKWDHQGFQFDMGPSWYWMPDVFERFYQLFGHTHQDFYELKRLDPSYQVFWSDREPITLPADFDSLKTLFDGFEAGSGDRLAAFLKEAKIKYDTAMSEFIYRPSLHATEYADLQLIQKSMRLDLFQSIAKHIRKYVQDPHLVQLLEFPVLFLGAKPQETPALYSMMNYADMMLGTWYPLGGMTKISEAFHQILAENKVELITDTEVDSFILGSDRNVKAVSTSSGLLETNLVISGADYHHTEMNLLPNSSRSYSKAYWDKKVMAPSSLLFYVGVDKKIPGLEHHNLFFDAPFSAHAKSIYDDHIWPEDPLFYVCAPSKTDPVVAPEGKENLFILIPLSTRLKDDPSKHDHYFNRVLDRMERQLGCTIKDHVLFHRSYCINDFIKDYHSFRGNAYGMANTLLQTGPLRPKIKSKKVNNLFFTGQLTVPGPGLPPAVISGEVVAKYILKKQKPIQA